MRFRDFHRNIQIRIVIQFLITLATTMFLPFLAIYFAKAIGELMTGIFYIVVILSGVIGGMVGGHISDQIGRKKLMILSEFFIGLTYAAIAVVNSPWLEKPYITISLFILNMFFSGLLLPAAGAMIIDVSTVENRKYVYSISYWANNLAMALGGVVGAFMFTAHRFELFLIITIVSFSSLLTTIFFISETYIPVKVTSLESSQKSSIFHTYKKVLQDKTFLMYIVASLLILSIEQQLTNYIGIRLEKEMVTQALLSIQNWSLEVDGIKMLGFLKTENTIIVALAAGLIIQLTKSLRDSISFQTGALIFTVGYAVTSLSTSPWILFIAMLVATIGELMYVPIKQAYLGNLAPDDARSSYMAINGLTQYCSMIIGAIFITLGAFLNFRMISFIILIMGLTGMFCFQRVIRDTDVKNISQSVSC